MGDLFEIAQKIAENDDPIIFCFLPIRHVKYCNTVHIEFLIHYIEFLNIDIELIHANLDTLKKS